MEKIHYSVIKYIPDQERMEPINVGIIIQTKDDLQVKFDARMIRRSEVNDKDHFKEWKNFLEEEVRSPAIKGFKPSKSSPKIFNYLQSCLDADFRISKPSEHFAKDQRKIEEYIQYFYNRLVARETVIPEANLLNKYNRKEQTLKFLARGLV